MRIVRKSVNRKKNQIGMCERRSVYTYSYCLSVCGLALTDGSSPATRRSMCSQPGRRLRRSPIPTCNDTFSSADGRIVRTRERRLRWTPTSRRIGARHERGRIARCNVCVLSRSTIGQRTWGGVGVGRARAPWWRRAHPISHLGTLHTIRVCNTMWVRRRLS